RGAAARPARARVIRRDGPRGRAVRAGRERGPGRLPQSRHGLRAGRDRRVLRHQQRHPRPAHPAHVGDQRDQRHHPRRRAAPGRQRGPAGPHPGGAGHRGRLDQHLRRVRGDRADARDVPEELGAVAAAIVLQASYLVAGVLFVMSLAGLSRHETARRGNVFGVVGMALALAATIWLAVDRAAEPLTTALLIAGAMSVGAAIGLWRARVVEMTGMPELVAILHSFVGLAAVLVGYNSFRQPGALAGAGETIHLVEVFLGVLIGAVTFTGSVEAFLKLSGRVSSNPLVLPHRHLLNLAALLACAALLVWFLVSHALLPLLVMTVIALALGLHLDAPSV